MFRDYGGLKVLCEFFEKHRSLSIANALVHVINPLDSNSIHCFPFLHLTRHFFLEITNNDILTDFGKALGNVFVEGALDEKETVSFLNTIIAFKNKIGLIYAQTILLIGLAMTAHRFIGNRSLCLKVLRAFDSFNNSEPGKCCP